MYESPDAELITFKNDEILSIKSGSCKCFIEDQVVDNIYEAGTPCYTDTEGADAYNLHGQVIGA